MIKTALNELKWDDGAKEWQKSLAAAIIIDNSFVITCWSKCCSSVLTVEGSEIHHSVFSVKSAIFGRLSVAIRCFSDCAACVTISQGWRSCFKTGRGGFYIQVSLYGIYWGDTKCIAALMLLRKNCISVNYRGKVNFKKKCQYNLGIIGRVWVFLRAVSGFGWEPLQFCSFSWCFWWDFQRGKGPRVQYFSSYASQEDRTNIWSQRFDVTWGLLM